VDDEVEAVKSERVDRGGAVATQTGPGVVEVLGPCGQPEPRQVEGDAA